MNRLDVWIDDETLGGSATAGRLTKAASKTGDTISFEYARQWLASAGPPPAFPLDPELTLAAGPHYARAGASALTGAFLDCSPDRWGKRLMDRREAIEAREEGRRARNLRAWDYLIGVNDESRMGALRLVDPESGQYVDGRALSAPPITELRSSKRSRPRLSATMPTTPSRWSAGSSNWSRRAHRWVARGRRPASVIRPDSCGWPNFHPMTIATTWGGGNC